MNLLSCTALGCALFLLGLLGVLRHRVNFIGLLMSLEIMLLGTSTNFIAFAHFHHALDGQVMSLFVLAVAAAESAIGLAIFILYFRNHHTMDMSTSTQLHG